MSDTSSTSDLDTLRREIAEALGWRVEFLSDSYGPGIQYGYWCLKMPDGEFPPIDGTEYYGYGWGDDTEASAWKRTPDWSRNTDAALALWAGSGVQFELSYLPTPPGNRPWMFVAFVEPEAAGAEAETLAGLAEPVARAWLAWRRAGEG